MGRFQPTRVTMVTPSPPWRGSALSKVVTSGCLRSMSRTARRKRAGALAVDDFEPILSGAVGDVEEGVDHGQGLVGDAAAEVDLGAGIDRWFGEVGDGGVHASEGAFVG